MSIPLADPRSSCDRVHGYSLLEVLVALTILGTGLLAQAGAITMVTRLVDQSREAGRAGYVAVSWLENLRLQAGSSPLLCADSMSGGPHQVGSTRMTWTSAPIGAVIHASVHTVYWSGRHQVVDTVSTAIPC